MNKGQETAPRKQGEQGRCAQLSGAGASGARRVHQPNLEAKGNLGSEHLETPLPTRPSLEVVVMDAFRRNESQESAALQPRERNAGVKGRAEWTAKKD